MTYDWGPLSDTDRWMEAVFDQPLADVTVS